MLLMIISDVSASIQYSALMKDPQWQQRSARNSLKSMKGNVTVNKIPQPSNKLPTLPIKSHSKKKKRSSQYTFVYYSLNIVCVFINYVLI